MLDQAGLVTAAARCWRMARDERQPTQRSLYALLQPLDAELLAPVFDSLMTLCESAMDRPFKVGDAAGPSTDEALLLGLLDGSRRRDACIDCAQGAATALNCAICSTRIMMALVAEPSRTVQ
ncbi:hypothetical protein P7B02_15930 [Caulobacter segnis]|uniref:hypothetical protein n=1 Tax=Caulobacter segnis TaxID=88688 RepID=UPI00241024DC|nr:hypothetical protein [Caulobacter segnis]MDG2523025.1 hypothetical protein [Caulobacter segnis]